MHTKRIANLFHHMSKFLQPHQIQKMVIQHLNVVQTTAALRPFYFAVHPDFFGKFPRERSVNEDSLKRLNEYVTAIHSGTPMQPINVEFFLRDTSGAKGIQDIRIPLNSSNIRTTVKTILKMSELPLDYLDTIAESKVIHRNINWHSSLYASSGKKRTKPKQHKPKLERTLREWLRGNARRVDQYTADSLRSQQEIDKLCLKIEQMIGVKSVRWENTWGNNHYMGCLLTFYKLCADMKIQMAEILAGRDLVFGNETGVNIHGQVVLASEDVPTTWMWLLIMTKAYDPVLARLPRMEKELSRLLNNIQIVRRHRHEVVMAQNYEVLLNRILNTTRRCQTLIGEKFKQEDLSHLVMVIETVSGPLTLTPGGQFLIPPSVPGHMMLDFIAENKDEAANRLVDAKIHAFAIDKVCEECKSVLGVTEIYCDDVIAPQQMIVCCQRLLDNEHHVGSYLKGKRLNVSTYYTVMSDGEMTIPWNWLEDK